MTGSEDELGRARAKRAVRAAFGSLDQDGQAVVQGVLRVNGAVGEALLRLFGDRITPAELAELERMKVLATQLMGRLTPEELAELLAFVSGSLQATK